MSFLKFKQNRKLTDSCREHFGSLLPVETLNLDFSISAVAYNLSLNCKSCISDCDSPKDSETCNNNRDRNYSGLIGVVSKECFMIYQLDMKNNEAFASKHILNLHVPNSNNHPTIRSYIMEAKWVKLRKLKTILTVLVLTTNVGVCIYTEDGSKLLCSHEHLSPEEATRGIIASTQHQILVGNGKGEVLTFNFSEGTVNFRNTSAIQPEPITQMHCRQNILASGSPSGTVRVWKINNLNASKKCCFKTPSEECVTGLRIWEVSYIIASYGSGVIRIFSWTYKRLLVRIFAHSRWITGLDFLPHLGKLLTVAEDDVVLIWKLSCSKKGKGEGLKGLGTIGSIKKKIKDMNRTWKPKQPKPKISVCLDSAIHTENMLLIGGKFLNCSGTAVALANFGVRELYFYADKLD